MANIFREAFVPKQGTGVTINQDNQLLRAEERELVNISIGNDVGVTAQPLFLSVTSTSQEFQINQFIITPNAMTGSINLLGDLTLSTTLTVGNDMRVLGATTASKIESQQTQSFTIFDSGSSLFGDSVDDTHKISGSLLSSGSIVLNNGTIQNISNDTALSDNSTQDIVTERAGKTYIDNIGYEGFQTYQRKCFPHTGSFINSTTSSFNAVTASAPSGFTSTTKNDFMFFINGVIVENDGVDIQQVGSSLLLKIDTSNVGYVLSVDDEVVGWGKFNS